MAKAKTMRKRRRRAVAAPAKTARKVRRRVRRRARKNPAGELATILLANGGPMKKRRKRRRIVGAARVAHAPRRRRRRRRVGVHPARLHRLVRRRARRNPTSGIGALVSDTLSTTAGVVAGRFAQNFSAIKLEKGKSPADAKAQAGKPLYIGIGTAVPIALGLLLKKLAKQDRIGNGLIVGGLTFAVHELARQFVFSKAPESSPLYALGEEDLGELGAVAQGDDGTEWAYVAGRGWHQIHEATPMLATPMLSAGRVQRRLVRALDGLEVRDTLGAVELRDTLGEEAQYVGADWDSMSGVELRDALGSEDAFLGAPYGYGDEG